jgi:starvation-inducible DNA-binding protein
MSKLKTTADPLTQERTNVGLDDGKRSGIVEALNALLADEFLLYTKTRKYHWNVMGPRFHDLHLFFEKQYEQLDEIMDEVAENAREFGGFATATMTEYLKISRLKENPDEQLDEDGMITNLLTDHETIIRQLRVDIQKADDEYNAADASDFLTGVLEDHNKMAWMLRACLPRR